MFYFYRFNCFKALSNSASLPPVLPNISQAPNTFPRKILLLPLADFSQMNFDGVSQSMSFHFFGVTKLLPISTQS